jgi:hypothetical protein
MNKIFNLKQYTIKAFYDDDRGLMQGQTRAMQNCYKQQCDKKKQPQEAWNTCLEEYNKTEDKGKWVLNYAGAKDEGVKQPLSVKTPAAQKIIKDK